MIAPKGPGHTVRSEFVEGKGVPALIAVEQDYTGHCLEIGLAYGAGIGAARAALMETTFKIETETEDVYKRQVELCVSNLHSETSASRDPGAGLLPAALFFLQKIAFFSRSLYVILL